MEQLGARAEEAPEAPRNSCFPSPRTLQQGLPAHVLTVAPCASCHYFPHAPAAPAAAETQDLDPRPRRRPQTAACSLRCRWKVRGAP